MSYPREIYIPVPGTQYHLEVDKSKWDCNRERAHCHVYNSKGARLAQVWLSSCTFKELPSDISNRDHSRILDTVSDYRWEIEDAYNYNRKFGAG